MSARPELPPAKGVAQACVVPILPRLVPWMAGLIAITALVVWWRHAQITLSSRIPGADRESESGATSAGSPSKWDGRLIAGNATPASLTGQWPRFRGPHADAISTDGVPLARNWPAAGPRVLWKVPVGEGYAGAAIYRGRVYVMDYDQPNAADALRCLSLGDGGEIWRYTYPVKVKRDHGMSRTVPTITEQHLIAIGPKCQVICVEPLTGQLQWQLNMVREFATEVPPWYAGQCPLVDGERLILGTGGEALVVAVDLATGKPLWKSPNPKNWQMTHSSVVPVEIEGERQYVYCASGGVVGVSARDGSLLWETPDWKISIANVPSPIHLGGGRLFLCGGYNAGSMMIQVHKEGASWKAETRLKLKPAIFGATQQTPIFTRNHLFGVRPDGQLVCLNLEGQPVWESGATHRFGNGPFIVAQDMILVMNDGGLLTQAELTTTGFKILAQAKVLEGHDSWGPLAIADGRLIARDLTEMVCLDLAAR